MAYWCDDENLRLDQEGRDQEQRDAEQKIIERESEEGE